MGGDIKEILTKTKFPYIWASQLFSQFTINILNFLFLIKLFESTGSSIVIALLWITFALPAILVGPFASVSVDLINKRTILIVTNLLQAVTILLYGLYLDKSAYLIFGVAFIYSLLNQFYVPAESATIPIVVDKKQYPFANSLFFLTQQASLIIGFGAAGILNKYFGFRNTVYFCALLLFLAFLSTLKLPHMKNKEIKVEKIEQDIFKFFYGIKEGYYFIKNQRSVILPFFLLLFSQIALAVVTVSMPVFAKNMLRVEFHIAGPLIVIPAAMGALIAGIYIPRMLKNGTRKRKIIKNSLKLSGFFMFLLVFVSSIENIFLRLLLMSIIIAVVGFTFVGIVIPSQTFLQEVTPGGYRGRVFGNFWVLSTLASIIPVLFTGAFTEIFGVNILILFLAFMVYVVYFVSKSRLSYIKSE